MAKEFEETGESPDKEKKEMPQTDEDKYGISQDYTNALSTPIIAYRTEGREGLIDYLREKGSIQKYEERFPSSRYKNVITPQNQEKIAQINAMVDSLNADFSDLDNLDADAFIEKALQIIQFIREN